MSSLNSMRHCRSWNNILPKKRSRIISSKKKQDIGVLAIGSVFDRRDSRVSCFFCVMYEDLLQKLVGKSSEVF